MLTIGIFFCQLLVVFGLWWSSRGWTQPQPLTDGLSPMILVSYFGIIAAYLSIRPFSRLEALWIFLIGLVLESWLFVNRPFTWDFRQRMVTIGPFLSLTCGAGIVYRCWREPGRRLERFALLAAAGGILLFPRISLPVLQWIESQTPEVYDPVGYAFDASWGIQPAFLVAKLIEWAPAIRYALIPYLLLPMWLTLAILCRLNYPHRTFGNTSLAIALAGTLGMASYLVLPMLGIDYLIPTGVLRAHPPPVPALIPLEGISGAPRSCLPSLHFAWILLFYWSVSHLGSAVRFLSRFIVFATFLGTLSPYVGHYLVDDVAAVPFALLCLTLASPELPWSHPLKQRAALWGVVGYAWILVVGRWFPDLLLRLSFGVAALQLITASGALLLGRRLTDECLQVHRLEQP